MIAPNPTRQAVPPAASNPCNPALAGRHRAMRRPAPAVHHPLAALIAATLAGAGCSDAGPPPAGVPTPAAASASAVDPTAWLGRWTGPEGTYLEVSGGADGGYTLTLANLDGPRTFDGRRVDAGIAFERDGRTHPLRRSDGAGTGMKWLAGKTDCLVVEPGEGFCRD